MEIRSRLPGFANVISPLNPSRLRSKGRTSFSSVWTNSAARLSDFKRKWALRANIFSLSFNDSNQCCISNCCDWLIFLGIDEELHRSPQYVNHPRSDRGFAHPRIG